VSGLKTTGRRRLPSPRGATLVLMTVLVVGNMIVAACASSATTPDSSRAPAAVGVVAAVAPAPSATPALAAAQANAMAAYAGYINAETTASATADYGSTALSKYASDPLLGQWIAELFHLHVIGDVQRGAVISHPQLLSLKLSKKSGTAIIQDCLDQSQISIVNATSGKSVPLPKTKPYVAIATMYLYSTGAWMVSSVDTSKTKPC
jgi:hypothetical protein